MWVWWATSVECVSAIARLQRRGSLSSDEVAPALQRLDALMQAWREIGPTESLRSTAHRLLRVHDLRAADALQLAAAIIASEGTPHDLDFLTLDNRLLEAAAREGFRIVSLDLR